MAFRSPRSGPEFDPKYVCNAFAKIAQVVAEARLLAPGVRERPKKRDFLLETRSPEEVEEELQAWVQEFLGGRRYPLVLSIAMDSAVELMPSPRGHAPVSCRMQIGGASAAPRYRVLEQWVLRYEQGPSGRGGEIPAYNVAKQLFLLVRSVYSCLRMLPCHRTVSKLRCRDPSLGLKYRLSTSLAPDRTEIPLGSDMTEYRFGDVETPSGRVVVTVQYTPTSTDDLVAPLEPALVPRERSVSLPTEPRWMPKDILTHTPASGRLSNVEDRLSVTPESRRHPPGEGYVTPNSAPDGSMAHATSNPADWLFRRHAAHAFRRADTAPTLPGIDTILHTIPGSREGDILAFSGSPPGQSEMDLRQQAAHTPVHTGGLLVTEKGFHVPASPRTAHIRPAATTQSDVCPLPHTSSDRTVAHAASVDVAARGSTTFASGSPHLGGASSHYGTSSPFHAVMGTPRGGNSPLMHPDVVLMNQPQITAAVLSQSPMESSAAPFAIFSSTPPQHQLLSTTPPTLLAELRKGASSSPMAAHSPMSLYALAPMNLGLPRIPSTSGLRNSDGRGSLVRIHSAATETAHASTTSDDDVRNEEEEEVGESEAPFAMGGVKDIHGALASIVRQCQDAQERKVTGEETRAWPVEHCDETSLLVSAGAAYQVTVGDLLHGMEMMQTLMTEKRPSAYPP